jgi:hypothetical protein
MPKLGTEKTPQCRKIPTFAASYHAGRGLVSIDAHVGSYGAPAASGRRSERSAAAARTPPREV